MNRLNVTTQSKVVRWGITMMARKDVRADIIAQGCEKCGEPLPDEGEFVLTFYRGRFIVLHTECGDFINHATKGPRAKQS